MEDGHSKSPGLESIASQKEKEDRLRVVKERQNEERQRKLEELKAQALAAQKYREQKDEERRRRIDDMKARDADRRSAVEERKRAIEDAERDRREYLLRKNVDREAKFDAKRRSDRNSAVFAFGSSTPRLLDPGEMGSVSPSNFWNHRRATSISNISYSGQPFSRRSVERDLGEAPKKRATSAGGDRQMDGLRSGEVTPGGTGSSRPTSAMSTSTITSTVSRRSVTTPRKPRPVSIAGTGMSVNGSGVDLMTASCSSIISNQNHRDSSNKLQKERPPLPKQQLTPSSATKRAPSLTSSRDSLMTRSMDLSKRTTPVKKTPAKAATPLQSPGQEQKPIVAKQKSVERIATNKAVNKETPKPQETMTVTETVTESLTTTITSAAEQVVNETVEVIEQKLVELQLEPQAVEAETPVSEVSSGPVDSQESSSEETPTTMNNNPNDLFIEAEKKVAIPNQEKIVKEIQNLEKQQESADAAAVEETPVEVAAPVVPAPTPAATIEEAVDMTASMIAKSKITTEEEAKAALAERRRLARVEAERQAELERQRIEAEQEAERKHLMEEEERYRQMEVEANRMAQEARQAEESRLAQAIEEAQKKEEEERQRREEENRMKQEQLEQERKAREEAEKQRLEMAEKLKKEEKEREERRKRVEAIMSRTRAKGSAPNTPVKSGEEEKSDASQKEEATDKDIPRDEKAADANQTPATNGSGNNNHESSFQAPEQHQQQGTNGVLGLKNGQQDSYEKSVTDKENALLGSFDNHFISDAPVETNNNNLTTNTTAMETVLSAAPGENGFHKNGIDNSLNSVDIASQMLIDENNAKNLALSASEMITTSTTSTTVVVESSGGQLGEQKEAAVDQLIDFGSGDSMPHINNNANILNNNNNTTTTTTGAASQLVTDLPIF